MFVLLIQKERLAWYFLSEDKKASQFTSYTISGGKAKSFKISNIKKAEIIDWDIHLRKVVFQYL